MSQQWLSISEYMRRFAVSRKSVEAMVDQGLLISGVVGSRKVIMVKTETAEETIERLEKKIDAMLEHFGVR